MSVHLPLPTPAIPGFSGRERRTTPRYDVLGQLNVHVVSQPMSVTVREMGAGGFSIETTEPIAVGAVHRFQFYFHDEASSVAASAKCVHSMRMTGKSRLPIYLSGFAFEPGDGPSASRMATLLNDIAEMAGDRDS
jgi:hypothetical protein